MQVVSGAKSRAVARVGGWSLIAAAAGFMAVFSYLAAAFDYPSILDGTAADVLPRLLELGFTGRAVWVVYAFLPLLLIPAAIGVYAALHDSAPHAVRAALTFAVIAAVSMLVGLARWPSFHWELARAYATASPDARLAMDVVFRGSNVYLGNFIGEFLGELSLSAFFLLSGVALMRAKRSAAGYGGLTAGAMGLVSAFRNVAPAVSSIAAVNNYVLPVWLVALGVVLIREPGGQP